MHAPRLRESILALGTLQVAQYLVPLVTLPYLTRTLGVDAFGKVAFASALVAYFVLLTEFGFGWSATREISAARGDKEAVSRLFWDTWAAQWTLAGLSLGVLCLAVAAIPALRNEAALYFASFGQVLGTLLFPAWLMQGLERMRAMAAIEVAGRLLTIPLLLLLVHGPEDAAWAAASMSGAGIFAGLAVVVWLKKAGILAWHRPTASGVLRVFREGAPLFWSRVWISTYTTLLPVTLGITAGTTAVGHFTLAEKIMRAVQSLLQPVSQALYPRLSFLYRSNPESAKQLLGRSAVLIATCAFVLSVLLWLSADLVVGILAGSAYAPAAGVLRLLAPLPFVVALSNIFGVQIMLPRGLNTQFTRIVRASALAGLVLMVPLCLLYADTGAALSWLLTELCVTVLMYSYVTRHGHFRFRHG